MILLQKIGAQKTFRQAALRTKINGIHEIPLSQWLHAIARSTIAAMEGSELDRQTRLTAKKTQAGKGVFFLGHLAKEIRRLLTDGECK